MHPLNETSDTDDTDSESRTKRSSGSRRGTRNQTKGRGLALIIEPERLGICRLPPKTRIPTWVYRSNFFSVARTREELSIVCEEKLVPKSIRCEVGWRAIKVKEPLDPSLIGVLASLANPLTEAGVSIFSISTYDTDYLLVRYKKLKMAQRVLEEAGHCFIEDPSDSAVSAEATQPEEAPPAKTSPAKTSPAKNEEPPKRQSKRKPAVEADAATDETPSAKPRVRSRRRRGADRERPAKGASTASRAARVDEEPTEIVAPTAEGAAGVDVREIAAASAARKAQAAAAEDPDPKAEASRSPVADQEPDEGADDGTSTFRDNATRRMSIRSEERRQRLSQALRRFGAALTNDPRFGETTPEDEALRRKEAGTSSADDTSSATSTPPKAASEADELDLDWESELVGKQAAALEAAAGAQGSAKAAKAAKTPKDAEIPKDAETTKDAEASEVEVPFAAATSGAFEGESLSIGEEEVEEDEGLMADGLFTGAIPQNDVEVTDQSFATLGLSDAVLEAVQEMGFEHPTPIQAAVVPEALEGVDVIGLAETGSGKTAAFVLPLAERLRHGKGTRGLILCPTREIALQTKSFIDSFGKNHKLSAVAVIGGVKMQPQIDRLRAKPDIVVATPGRLADHMRRRNVDLSRLEELVIDEADHMLDLGFLPQIKEILEQVPRKRRSMMFSATMLPPIARLAQQFMNEPLTIDIRPINKVAEGIEHRLYLVHDADLKVCLLKLLDEVQGSTLIFARRKLHTEWLARQLQQAGCPSDRIHSDRTQAQRVRALRGFREGKFRILVATDVAARGIDVPRIQHVINYGLPESVEDYVHRAGRTARGNSVGIVSSIGTWQDKAMVREMESSLGIEMPRCSVEGIEPYVELRPRRKTVRRRRLL